MSEENLQTASEEQTPDYENEVAKLRSENARLSQSVSKLEDKRTEALDEAKKLKRINKLLAAIGIDHDDEEAESILAEKLLATPAPATKAEPDPLADTAESNAQPQQPQGDPIQEAELKRLKRQVQKLQEDAEAAERAKNEAIAKNRADRIERVVVEALSRAGAANPSHAYRLMQTDNRFRVDLSEDGTNVVGGPDYDPKPLMDVVAAFRDDDVFSYMFNGSGMSGSGSGSRAGSNGSTSGTHSANNPFRTDSLNVTQAAICYQQNPEKAKRLMAEARSAGKLDPKFASLK